MFPTFSCWWVTDIPWQILLTKIQILWRAAMLVLKWPGPGEQVLGPVEQSKRLPVKDRSCLVSSCLWIFSLCYSGLYSFLGLTLPSSFWSFLLITCLASVYYFIMTFGFHKLPETGLFSWHVSIFWFYNLPSSTAIVSCFSVGHSFFAWCSLMLQTLPKPQQRGKCKIGPVQIKDNLQRD